MNKSKLIEPKRRRVEVAPNCQGVRAPAGNLTFVEVAARGAAVSNRRLELRQDIVQLG
jgi:hypothetical protein